VRLIIEKYVHSSAPGDVWAEVVMTIGVVSRVRHGNSQSNLPAPDVSQSMLPRLYGYLGFHVDELGGAVIGRVIWIDTAMDDARQMLIGAGARSMAETATGEFDQVKCVFSLHPRRSLVLSGDREAPLLTRA
jgi:hypothetical protein